MKNSGGPLDNQTWQTEWKTAPLAKVQLCEHENKTFDLLLQSAVALQNFLDLATANICETGLLECCITIIKIKCTYRSEHIHKMTLKTE